MVRIRTKPVTAQNKWQLHFSMYELEQKMRSIEDPQFSALCDRVGTNSLTQNDVRLLEQRIQPCPQENDNDQYKDGKLLILVTDNKRREAINDDKLQLIDGEASSFDAIDRANTPKYNEAEVSQLTCTKTGGLPANLKVKVNCPVMVTVNIDKEDGLTNGIRGYVTRIDRAEKIIWVKFPKGIGIKAAAIGKRKYNFGGKHGSVPIRPTTMPFRHNAIRIRRTQFPLVLAYAITTHKSQGQTTDASIIDYRSEGNTTPRFDYGMFYVALTRAKKLENVYLRSFDRSMVNCNPQVIAELQRLRKPENQYKFSKKYLYDEDNLFEFPENEEEHEVKVAYLNINGLLHAHHIDCLRSDNNLSAVDIICIAETKLSPDVGDATILLDGFDLLHRLDVRHNSMGMAIYSKTGTSANIIETARYSDEDVQIIQFTIDDQPTTFIYIHPNSVITGLAKLETMLRAKELVMGDINIDAMNEDKRILLNRFCARNDLIVANLNGPTHNNCWIDHILYSMHFTKLWMVGNYRNFYSDHNSITVRFSNNAIGV